MDKPVIQVEVCYAEPGKPVLLELSLPEGSTLIDAIRKSGIEKDIPFPVTEGATGIYGRKRPFHSVLKDGDRVEIYRPLKASLDEIRKRRMENS